MCIQKHIRKGTEESGNSRCQRKQDVVTTMDNDSLRPAQGQGVLIAASTQGSGPQGITEYLSHLSGGHSKTFPGLSGICVHHTKLMDRSIHTKPKRKEGGVGRWAALPKGYPEICGLLWQLKGHSSSSVFFEAQQLEFLKDHRHSMPIGDCQ